MTWKGRLERFNTAFIAAQFTLSKQLSFLHGLFTLMADGIATRDALRLLMNTGTPIDQYAARAMLLRFREGRGIASGMQQIFQPELVSAITAAEQSDNFAESGLKVVGHVTQQHEAGRGVVAKLSRPFLYLLFSAGLYVLFAAQIWPRFEELVPTEHWHPLARNNYLIGLFVMHWWWLTLALLVLMTILCRLMLRHWRGRGRLVLDRLWPFTLYRQLVGANVLEFVGTMLVAGHDFRTALATVQQRSIPYANLYINVMRRRLRDGRSIPRAMDVGMFSNADISRLKLLAEYKGLRDVMISMGSASRDSVLSRFKLMADTLNVVGMALVALSYAALVGSLYLNSNNLQQMVQL